MKIVDRKTKFAFMVMASVALLAACGNENRRTALYEKAQACYEEKNYVCAKDNLEQAVAIDPEFADAHAGLGEVYLKLGEVNRAFDAYARAADLAPDTLEIQLRLATLHLLNRDTAAAHGILTTILKNAPDNLTARYLLAELYHMENNPQRAEEIFVSIIDQDAEQLRAYLSLANLLVRRGDFDTAEQYLGKAIQQPPASLHPVFALLNLHLIRGKFTQAESLLIETIEKNPNITHLQILLGNLYLQARQLQKAEIAFLKAVEQSPSDPRPHIIAANFFSATNRPNQALTLLQQALELQPGNPGILQHLASFHFNQNAIETAASYNEKILAKNPDYLPAQIMKAEILMARNAWDEALVRLVGMQRDHPGNTQLIYMSGLVHLKKEDFGRARADLEKIKSGAPEYISARLLLAGIFIGENRLDLAEKACNDILAVSPGHYEARKLLGNIALLDNRPDDAKAHFTELANLTPENPEPHYLIGKILLREQEYAAAAEKFDAALARSPNRLDIFSSMISALLNSGQIKPALKRVDDMLDASTKNPVRQAVIFNLKGQLQVSIGNIREAESSFKKSMLLAPDYLPPYYALAHIYLGENRIEKAISQYQFALEQAERREIPHMMLGIIYSLQNEWDLAEQHYRSSLESNPKFAPAANNLAYLLAEREKHLPDALRYARLAHRLTPEDHRVLDTLGWVYVKLGMYDQAVRKLTQSLEHAPDNPTILYHLGVAYYKSGAMDQAEARLKQALDISEDFEGARHAKEILAVL
jgi:tetratricopeptide (TPR) repeat protein